MSRSWLKPFAAGSAIVAIPAIGAWAYTSYHKVPKSIVLQYNRLNGLREVAPPPDPAVNYRNASDYLVAIAEKCRLRNWAMELTPPANDADDIARLSILEDAISDQSFNCLAQFAKPPFVTLERKNR